MKVKRIKIKTKKYDFTKMTDKEIERVKQEIEKEKEKYEDKVGVKVIIQRNTTRDGRHDRGIVLNHAVNIAEFINKDGYHREEEAEFFNTEELLTEYDIDGDEDGYTDEVRKVFDSVEEAENWTKKRST